MSIGLGEIAILFVAAGVLVGLVGLVFVLAF